MTPIQADLLTFLQDRRADGPAIDSATDLFDTGVLDSLMLLDLILHIQKVHAVVLTALDVTKTNFCNVAALAQMVQRRAASPDQKAA
jgi:acyl carrier protein